MNYLMIHSLLVISVQGNLHQSIQQDMPSKNLYFIVHFYHINLIYGYSNL